MLDKSQGIEITSLQKYYFIDKTKYSEFIVGFKRAKQPMDISYATNEELLSELQKRLQMKKEEEQ